MIPVVCSLESFWQAWGMNSKADSLFAPSFLAASHGHRLVSHLSARQIRSFLRNRF